MDDCNYIMEGEDECTRLELKTDPEIIKELALWAGIRPGMRIADLGCGPGKTTFHLNNLVQPGGTATGLDISQERIDYAHAHYSEEGTEFIIGDIRKSLDRLGLFDFTWVRFVLEHHLANSFDIVKNISSVLKPGGIMCLVDLDYNCLSHYGLSLRLEETLHGIMSFLEKRWEF